MFELIAMKLFKGRNPAYLKILKPGIFYYLNSDYKISAADVIKRPSKNADNFYTSHRPSINVSGIVGKNGSGKSSLVEMMLRLLNNFGKKHDKQRLDLQYVQGINVSLYFRMGNDIYKLHGINREIKVYKFNHQGHRLKRPIPSDMYRSMFYTIMINYSHYAFNTNDFFDEGPWLAGLFHKNDGYQTPIVLNPFRDEGNIEINNEHHLAKSRLIANYLKKNPDDEVKFRNISDKQVAYSLNLTLNTSKRNAIIYEAYSNEDEGPQPITLEELKINRKEVFGHLERYYRFGYRRINQKSYQIALDYILYKLVSICVKYREYHDFYNREKHDFNYEKLDLFFKTLFSDNSHITFKLRQTLNFLKYRYLKLADQSITLDELSDIILTIKQSSRKFFERAHFVPPPIFSTEIMTRSRDEKSLIHLSKLSSGEKQLLYSVSSMLYHLKNLDSIRNTKRRTGYKYVNIILEEVELYFHPEMQRSYVNYVIDCIEKMELQLIRSINMIFVTHSPFVLSDIPKNKVLFLEETGKPKVNKEETFGSNIHDLLANSFFLGNGFIGEFAKRKIQSVIDELNDDIGKKRRARPELLEIIECIGEPFLKVKLSELYFQTVPGDISKEKKILELEEQLKRLKQ